MSLIFLAIPATIGAVFLVDKALAYLVRRKYERMLYSQYYRGVKDTQDEQKAIIHQLRTRICSLEEQARRLRQTTSNGVQP